MSTNSKLVIAGSADHDVPRRAPEFVVEGINWVRENIGN